MLRRRLLGGQAGTYSNTVITNNAHSDDAGSTCCKRAMISGAAGMKADSPASTTRDEVDRGHERTAFQGFLFPFFRIIPLMYKV